MIAMCAVIGGAFAYAACDWGQWPRLSYMPIQRAFGFHVPAGTVAMVYPGIVLWGVSGAATGALVGALACMAWKQPWPARALQLLGAWAITALVLAGAYYTWSLWPW